MSSKRRIKKRPAEQKFRSTFPMGSAVEMMHDQKVAKMMISAMRQFRKLGGLRGR